MVTDGTVFTFINTIQRRAMWRSWYKIDPIGLEEEGKL